jgi:hypothetical protein
LRKERAMLSSSDGFILRPRANPRRYNKLKAILGTGAGCIAFVAWYLSTLNALPGAMIYILYAAAAMDLGMAFFLPSIIEKQALAWRYLFFSDRFELAYGEKSSVFVLPYGNIETVEEIDAPADKEAGLVSIRLRTYNPIHPPRGLPGGSHRIALLSLPGEDRPFQRIKELVEKSRVA